MKMKYVKPAIVVERFTLAQSIATSCGADPNSTLGDPNLWSKASCGWNMGNIEIFLNEVICDWVIEDGEIEGICHNNPNGGQTIFAS